MAVTTADIEKIAHLARIRIEPEDTEEVAQRISDILVMVDTMQAVDTGNIEPMANPLDATQRLRADDVTETDRSDEFQQIAPHTEQNLYLVPKVIE
jgi:aspartyl-tRNA(Asn)/glutamyl-tRNA(Gln) amidotransferase subunit C